MAKFTGVSATGGIALIVAATTGGHPTAATFDHKLVIVEIDSQAIADAGTLSIVTSESTVGATKWDLWYLPLEDGATVVSA